ncbi:MAG: hypothetical protein Q8R98_22015 [Rubrivivax sp.]|nr:hypothetical protein [Rubrivivax sp.]MDP3614530.1 hypothetical protein [Rubrivivax sp.]
MPIIFRKTAKGVAEIETRAHRLTPRMRSALILVDGKRDAEDMKLLITQQAEETLQTLAEQGFIEAVGETVRSQTSSAPAAAPAAEARAAAPTTKPGPDFDNLRRSSVRALNEALGPSAESLAIRIERARNLQELQPLLSQAAKLIGAVRGTAAAEAYAARFPAN